MQCQVQMPYLEIFNLSVFPIFTDSWDAQVVQIVSKVYAPALVHVRLHSHYRP